MREKLHCCLRHTSAKSPSCLRFAASVPKRYHSGVKRFLQIGSLPLLALLLLSCRGNQQVIAKPHGLDLAALPTASDAPLFEPEDGHYAELLLRDGRWHGFVDGNPAADPADEDELSDFLRSFRSDREQEGWNPVVLISADGHVPLSEIKKPVRAAARAGIDKVFLHVRLSVGVENESPSFHSLTVYFTCPHCLLARYNPDFDPLDVGIDENGAILQKVDASLVQVDDSRAPRELPGLDSILSAHAERARLENGAPVVRIDPGEETPYQRLIDVLCRLHAHGLEPDFFTPDGLMEPGIE